MSNEVSKIPEAIKPEAVPGELSLADLISLAEPLVKIWVDSENMKHSREIEYENRLLDYTERQNKRLTIGLFLIAGLLLFIAGFLFYNGQDAMGMDLIQLIAAIGGAAFGGYGWALTRKRKEEKSD